MSLIDITFGKKAKAPPPRRPAWAVTRIHTGETSIAIGRGNGLPVCIACAPFDWQMWST